MRRYEAAPIENFETFERIHTACMQHEHIFKHMWRSAPFTEDLEWLGEIELDLLHVMDMLSDSWVRLEVGEPIDGYSRNETSEMSKFNATTVALLARAHVRHERSDLPGAID